MYIDVDEIMSQMRRMKETKKRIGIVHYAAVLAIRDLSGEVKGHYSIDSRLNTLKSGMKLATQKCEGAIEYINLACVEHGYAEQKITESEDEIVKTNDSEKGFLRKFFNGAYKVMIADPYDFWIKNWDENKDVAALVGEFLFTTGSAISTLATGFVTLDIVKMQKGIDKGVEAGQILTATCLPDNERKDYLEKDTSEIVGETVAHYTDIDASDAELVYRTTDLAFKVVGAAEFAGDFRENGLSVLNPIAKNSNVTLDKHKMINVYGDVYIANSDWGVIEESYKAITSVNDGDGIIVNLAEYGGALTGVDNIANTGVDAMEYFINQ